jgi:hypothetical protein
MTHQWQVIEDTANTSIETSPSLAPLERMRTHDLETLSEDTNTIVVDIHVDYHPKDDEIAPSDSSRFLQEHVSKSHHLIKLLLPASSGHVVQSDFLARRMVDCANVIEVRGFLRPGQYIEASKLLDYRRMAVPDLLARCHGALVAHVGNGRSNVEVSASINKELEKRLAFPWLSPSAIERKRVAMIGGGSLAKMSGFAVAAASLNVSMVVFDEASHWLSDAGNAHLRDEFVPFDMTPDTTMPQRLARRLREYQQNGRCLDGIMSVDEHLLTIVYHAAEILGLNASPPASVGLAQNKFQTRQLDSNVYCRLVGTPSGLEKMLQEDAETIRYPLIVKPARGWSSEGVWKVENEHGLRDKVPTLWQKDFTDWHGHGVVIETYVDGPEVDANMVLVDGEVVFFEVNDDFPSPGDYSRDEFEAKNSQDALVANFVETSNMIPSGLPSTELEALQQRLHQLALAAGFHDGVLHMEAKLRNSSCYYAEGLERDGEQGLVDLRRTTSTSSDGAASKMKPTDVFLLEINPRAPGWQEIEATAHAYGVSYYTLSVLHAIRDRERMTMLSHPFKGGAQYHMQLLFVAARRGGIYSYGDVCSTILSQHKDILTPGEDSQAQIIQSVSLMENGQDVPDPRSGKVYGNFIAFFLIASRTSRKEVIRFGRIVEELVRKHTNYF